MFLMFLNFFLYDFPNHPNQYIYISFEPILVMKKGQLSTVVRYILGIAMAFFGINGFLQFMTPPEMTAAANAFMGAMINTGYLFQLTNVIFIVVAILLLSNKYVPLALTLLFPVMLNVVFFHLFLDPLAGVMGYLVFIMNVYLIAVYESNFRPLLKR